jgi:hypothetical protein
MRQTNLQTFLLCILLISIACFRPLSASGSVPISLASYGTITSASPSPNPAPTPTPPSTQGLSPLHVSGSQLLDTNNNRVILRGAIYSSIAWGDSPDMLTESQFIHLQNMGCNEITVQIWTFQLYRGQFGGGSNDFSNPNFWADLDKIITWATAHDLYIVLDGYCMAGDLPDGYPTNDLKHVFSTYDTWNNFIGYWQTYANRYKNYNNIIYLLMGEPLDCNYATYTFYMQQTIDAIRVIDSDAICMIQNVNNETDYAIDMWHNPTFQFQQTNPINRPNIMFSFDPYGFMTYPDNSLAAIQNLYAYFKADWLVSHGYAIFLKECGPDLGTHESSYGSWDKTWMDKMFSYTDSVGCGYSTYWWRVSPGISGWTLISDCNGHLTTYGNDVKTYYLSNYNISVEPTIKLADYSKSHSEIYAANLRLSK